MSNMKRILIGAVIILPAAFGFAGSASAGTFAGAGEAEYSAAKAKELLVGYADGDQKFLLVDREQAQEEASAEAAFAGTD
ncbi:hypothetical protein ACQEU5_07010 [Marinactinospora thermotolerans]|uniref:Uncharacterized protein n=1 Tax=Marinactinospora thermotolerans DSM 45154 TaxID=1122192 RepID=A0A1T4R1A3_9ACTN|nr:hypothetical protein [Marinactinospora thermotolerans]SKA09636.1 hypothetical protein SAMN02745673_02423 [Marinactinospora thermotolerans DSM 45154]